MGRRTSWAKGIVGEKVGIGNLRDECDSAYLGYGAHTRANNKLFFLQIVASEAHFSFLFFF